MPASTWLRHRLVYFSERMAARFGAPVYLVGSALTENKPRDVDLRIPLDDEQFRLRYGQTVDEWLSRASEAWMNDMAKLNQTGVKQTETNLDFQVVPKSYMKRFDLRGTICIAALWPEPDYAI